MVRTDGWDRSGLDVIVETCEYLQSGGINLLPHKHLRIRHIIRAAQIIASKPALLNALPGKVHHFAPEWDIDYTLANGDIIKKFWEAFRQGSLK
jgi:hypothetical protein